MQISEAWLRSYVNPAISSEELSSQLTMAGLEVDSVTPVAAMFSHVVVGEVLAMEQHPDADRLRVCQVAVGQEQPLQIVCGASNVRIGLKVPAALIGAELPGDFKIKKSKLRGVESFGMLCSEKELGLATDAQGLMELPSNAPVGVDIREYLSLDDAIIEVDLTPNRADCLSVEGIAQEVAVLNQLDWSPTDTFVATVAHDDVLVVSVQEPDACPRYLGRLIKNVSERAETPLWMRERLRRSGLRSLGPIVDVTNYVLIELGQPLHAFDADKLNGNICVRYAKTNEPLNLLNDQTIKLNSDTLVIADDRQALAFAGVMGGNDSAVSGETQNVFLECAFFTPQSIAGKARQYGLHTDSSDRFERGVDPTLQTRAIERATQLILEIAGGSAGPISDVTAEEYLPKRSAVLLKKQRLEKMLGSTIPDEEVAAIFRRLGMTVHNLNDGWSVTPPGRRFDIAIEADLIEEIARIYGYNKLPNSSALMRSELTTATESILEIDRIADLLVDRGYQEAITYSFVDEDIQKLVAPNDEFVRLTNPISSEMSVMRTTLWCGLLKAALYNTNRQQHRVRLFETGLRFVKKADTVSQQKTLAGIALGSAYSEQWGERSRKIDFFDVKADIEAIFQLTGSAVTFVSGKQPSLHPGQTAEIIAATGEIIGWLGMLHPEIETKLGFDHSVYLFELDQTKLLNKQIPAFKQLSKFPSVRRDIALIVNENINASSVTDCVKACNELNLKDVLIFDLYQGKGIDEGCKSLALSLHLQNDAGTLTDAEIDAIVSNILKQLAEKLSAKLRD